MSSKLGIHLSNAGKKKKLGFKTVYVTGRWVCESERATTVNLKPNHVAEVGTSGVNKPLMFENANKWFGTWTQHGRFLPFGSRCDSWQFETSHPADNQQHCGEYSWALHVQIMFTWKDPFTQITFSSIYTCRVLGLIFLLKIFVFHLWCSQHWK